MGNKRNDFWRSVDLVVHNNSGYHTVSVFATTHSRGDRNRRLLWRARIDYEMPVDTAEQCLDLLVSAAEAVKDQQTLPWR